MSSLLIQSNSCKEENIASFCGYKIIEYAYGFKASRPGSRRRAEAGPVGCLNQWGMRCGSAGGLTFCQGSSPQKGPSEDRQA